MDIEKIDSIGILARTIWGENRNHGEIGMIAIACVIRNRVTSGITWWGTDTRSVCLHKFQFSCWNANDPNLPKMLAVDEANESFATAMKVAERCTIWENLGRDITDGATHYYAEGSPQPKWAVGASPCAVHSGHLFFKGIG